MGFRKEFLTELDRVVCDMRRPNQLAERSVKTLGERTQQASARTVSKVMQRGNETILTNL